MMDYNEDSVIPAFDGRKVHFVARNCDAPDLPLVLHIHGIPDSPRGLLGATSGEFFVAHGYAHAALYLNIDYDPTARSLKELSFANAIRDLETLITHFQQTHHEIFLTCHSVGASIALGADLGPVRALGLWDPATDSIGFLTGKKLLPEAWQKQGGACIRYQTETFLGADLIHDLATHDQAWFLARAAQTPQPTLVVAAGTNGIFQLSNRDPAACSNAFPNGSLLMIPQSGHMLTPPGARDEAFRETLRLFESCRARPAP